MLVPPSLSVCFFFNDTATTEIYTLSLHDALPICISLGELGDLLSRELFVGPHQQESSVGERRERGGTARQQLESVAGGLQIADDLRSQQAVHVGGGRYLENRPQLLGHARASPAVAAPTHPHA